MSDYLEYYANNEELLLVQQNLIGEDENFGYEVIPNSVDNYPLSYPNVNSLNEGVDHFIDLSNLNNLNNIKDDQVFVKQDSPNGIIKKKYNKSLNKFSFLRKKKFIQGKIKKEVIREYKKRIYNVNEAPSWTQTISAKTVNILKKIIPSEVKFTVQSIIINTQDEEVFNMLVSLYSDNRTDSIFCYQEKLMNFSVIIVIFFCVSS